MLRPSSALLLPILPGPQLLLQSAAAPLRATSSRESLQDAL